MAKTVRQKNPVSKPPTPKKENNEPYIIPQTRYNFSVLIIFKIPLRLLCLYDESYQIFKKKIFYISSLTKHTTLKNISTIL